MHSSYPHYTIKPMHQQHQVHRNHSLRLQHVLQEVEVHGVHVGLLFVVRRPAVTALDILIVEDLVALGGAICKGVKEVTSGMTPHILCVDKHKCTQCSLVRHQDRPL